MVFRNRLIPAGNPHYINLDAARPVHAETSQGRQAGRCPWATESNYDNHTALCRLTGALHGLYQCFAVHLFYFIFKQLEAQVALLVEGWSWNLD